MPPLSADDLKTIAALVAANPSILVVGYFLVRELRRFRATTLELLVTMRRDQVHTMRRLGLVPETDRFTGGSA